MQFFDQFAATQRTQLTHGIPLLSDQEIDGCAGPFNNLIAPSYKSLCLSVCIYIYLFHYNRVLRKNCSFQREVKDTRVLARTRTWSRYCSYRREEKNTRVLARPGTFFRYCSYGREEKNTRVLARSRYCSYQRDGKDTRLSARSVSIEVEVGQHPNI
jgi:hypothetical protein